MYSATPEEGFQKTPGPSYQSRNAHLSTMFMKKEDTNESENKTENKILTIPNLLSLFRLILIPVIIWLYWFRKDYFPAGVLLIISGLTDLADGYIARHFNAVSNVGKILDPIADKLTQAAMLFCLVTRFPLMRRPLDFL